MKLRIRTSSSQFILSDDQNAYVGASEGSTAEKTSVKLEQRATVNTGKGGVAGHSMVEPMDTEEKQTCNINIIMYWC